MPVYHSYSFASIYIEGKRGENSEPLENSLRERLSDIEKKALSSLDLDASTVRRAPVPCGSMLAWPGDIPSHVIAGRFIEALCEALRGHAARCAPAEPIRVRMALNAGESAAGEEIWSSSPATVAAKLADLPVIQRVLAASLGSPLALIVSDEWHASLRSLYGFQPVVVTEPGLAGPAWIKVPGNSRPPGLRPDDTWAPPHSATPATGTPHPAAAGPSFHGVAKNVIQAETVNGGVHIGHVFGDVRNRRPGGAR